MYQFTYADIAEDRPAEGRAREYSTMMRSIELMSAADAEGVHSRAAIEALFYTQRLWCILIEDLAKPENALPAKLRADLISIGLWILREVEAIRHGKSNSFKGLIEVSMTIAEGIK